MNSTQTPHELWYGETPLVKHFKNFGSKCYIKNNDEHNGRSVLRHIILLIKKNNYIIDLQELTPKPHKHSCNELFISSMS